MNNFIKSNYEIIFIILLTIIFYIFSYSLQLSLLVIIPLVIFLYKKQKKIKSYYLYSKIKFTILSILVILTNLPPLLGYDIFVDTYQKEIAFSCNNLKSQSNKYLISNYDKFAITNNSLNNLVNNIAYCNLQDKTPFLAYLFAHQKNITNLYYSTPNIPSYNPQALAIKHAIFSIFHKNIPDFEATFPDNSNNYAVKNIPFNVIEEQINNLYHNAN